MKLDIGSGIERYAPGWITVDYYAPADIKALMWELPFEDNSIEAIWCSHALEHCGREDAIATLKEFLRVLEPYGYATITVPDFSWVAAYWLNKYEGNEQDDRVSENRLLDPEWAEMMVFGNQVHEGEYHKSAWSFDKLRKTLIEVGFINNFLIERVWDHDQQSLRVDVVKL